VEPIVCVKNIVEVELHRLGDNGIIFLGGKGKEAFQRGSWGVSGSKSASRMWSFPVRRYALKVASPALLQATTHACVMSLLRGLRKYPCRRSGQAGVNLPSQRAVNHGRGAGTGLDIERHRPSFSASPMRASLVAASVGSPPFRLLPRVVTEPI